MSRRAVIAYWLIPCGPAHSFFQRAINDLAERYDAPAFEPHVTIHVGPNHIDAAKNALSKAACECPPIIVKPVGIDQSEEFIKTLFVQFATNRKLQRLITMVRNAAGDSCRYKFNPHLSLLYKKIPSAVRAELAESLNVPFSEVMFDALQAVSCISPTQNRADVEGWRVIATTSFRAERSGVEESHGIR
jgi:putative hydrolase of the HAD superfamily